MDGMSGYGEKGGRKTFFGGGPEVDGFGKVVHICYWWRRW